MKKQRLTVPLITIALLASAVAIGAISRLDRSARQDPVVQDKATVYSPTGLKPKPEQDAKPEPSQENPLTSPPDIQPEDREIPQYVVYGQMFRHLKELSKKAREARMKGEDGAHFQKLYQEMAKLNDDQAFLLNQIADDVASQMEPLDKRALQIITEIRNRHPDGRLAPGEVPPEPPAELRKLSEERRNLILNARERLRASFGEAEFQMFDRFVQQRIKTGIRRLDSSGVATHGASAGK